MITVQLKWIHQGQFAGFYVAESEGFYAEEDIEVAFLPAGVGIDVFDTVLSGNATFGVAGADSIIVERANGQPVVAIATIYRINPFVLVAFADSGIDSPHDFAGRTVMVSDSYGDVIQLNAMLSKVDVDPESVNTVPYTYDHSAFLKGEIDVMNSFAAGGLLTLKTETEGRELNLIWPGDYGVRVYADTIFATDELINNNSDLVLRFLRATLRGHRYAVENPDIALAASMQYADVQDENIQASMIQASNPLIHTGEDEIGWMKPEIWQSMYELLQEQGFVAESIAIEDVYTLRFLQAIYQE